jgi:uncharacterized membrane-anchored protein
MMKGKKYDYQVVQGDSGWTAEIIRKKTKKETIVSKSQSGFVSETEAREWAQEEIKTFLQKLGERNKSGRNKRGSK